MMRFGSVLGLIALVAATVLPLGARRAYACTCRLADTEEEMRETFGYYDLVVIGSVGEPDPSSAFADRVSIDVQRVLKGLAPDKIALNHTTQEAERRREGHIR